MENLPIQHKPDRIIQSRGKDYLYFSGTNYLGMASVPEFEALVVEGIRNYGLHYGSSRGNTVTLEVFDEFEGHFAKAAGAEAALLFSSGSLAGKLAVQQLQQNTGFLFVSPNTHPAIQPEGLVFKPRMEFAEWKHNCIAACEGLENQCIAFVSNAVDPLTLEIHDFSWINGLSPKNQYTLLIDDSHAFGVLGEDIYGTYSKRKSLNAAIIVCGSLGKGLCMPGGIVLGAENFIQSLRQHKGFRTAAPPPPAFFQAFLQGKHLFARQKDKLFHNVAQFQSLTGQLPFLSSCTKYPVTLVHKSDAAKGLLKKGFVISSFPYPTQEDPAINRIVISAFHREEDLQALAIALANLS